jgi:hypothetical protein
MKPLLAASVVALTTVALVGAPHARAADPHHHHHGASAASAQLKLDHGKKWATDEPLRRGMSAIREAVHGAAAPLHKGTAKPDAYAALGRRIEADVGVIVKECKLPPAADEQLHLVVADVIAGADAMKSAKDGKAGRAALIQVDAALKAYGKHFDHPGWK